MNSVQAPDIEDLIPHRGRMKLIDTIVTLDTHHAVTLATVSQDWPLRTADGVCPTILIELVAQTAGIAIGWQENHMHQRSSPGQGLLVGIKQARFFCDHIPLQTQIKSYIQAQARFQNFVQIQGKAMIADKPAADVDLQVFISTRAD